MRIALGIALVVLGSIFSFLAVDLDLRERLAGFLPAGAPRDALKLAAVVGVIAAGVRVVRGCGIGGWIAALAVAYSLAPLAMNSGVLATASVIGIAGFVIAVGGLGEAPGALDRFATAVLARGRRMRRLTWVLGLAAASFALNLVATAHVFDFQPSIIDTMDQVFQARCFAEGRLTAPAPPVPRAFEFMYMIIDGDRWYSQYPPGHPLLLTVGVLLGTPWLVGPALGALLTVVVYAIGVTVWGERTGRAAGALSLISPYMHLMSGSHMSHTACATMLAIGVWGMLRVWRGGGAGWAMLTGFGFGYALWTRPYPALALAVTAAGLSAIHVLRGGRIRWWLPVVAVLTAAIPVALLLVYNWKTNGDPLVFGYSVTQGPLHRLGFGTRVMNEQVRDYTLWEAVRQTGYHLAGLNAFALGTAIPLVALVPWTFLARRRHPYDLALLALATAPVAAFFIYPFTDFVLGPRLVFSALPFATLLAARSLVRLHTARVDGAPRAGRLSRRFVRPAAFALLALPCAAAFIAAMDFNARLFRPWPDRLAAHCQGLGAALVLCDDASFERYGFGRLRPGLPADRPVFARTRNASQLVSDFPGRALMSLAIRDERDVVLADYIPVHDLFTAVERGTPPLAANDGMQAKRVDPMPPGSDRFVGENHGLLYGYRTPASARFVVAVPSHASLAFSAMVFPLAWNQGSDGVTFRVRALVGDGEPQTLFSRHLGRGVSGLLDHEVDLGAFAGQTVSLWIEALPGPGGSKGDIFNISNPTIVRRIPR